MPRSQRNGVAGRSPSGGRHVSGMPAAWASTGHVPPHAAGGAILHAGVPHEDAVLPPPGAPLIPQGPLLPPPGHPHLTPPLNALVLGAETDLGRQVVRECLRCSEYVMVVAVSEMPQMLAEELELAKEDAARLRSVAMPYDVIEDGLRPFVESAPTLVAFSCVGITSDEADNPREFHRLNYEVPMRFVSVVREGRILRVAVLSCKDADMGSSRSDIRRLRGMMEDSMARMWEDECYITPFQEKGPVPGLVAFQAPLMIADGLKATGEYKHLTNGQQMSRKQLAKQRVALRFGVGPTMAIKSKDLAKAMVYEVNSSVVLMCSGDPHIFAQSGHLRSYSVEAEEIEELAELCREDIKRRTPLPPAEVLHKRLMAHEVSLKHREGAELDRRVVRRQDEFDFVPPTVAARMGNVIPGAPVDAVQERELMELGAIPPGPMNPPMMGMGAHLPPAVPVEALPGPAPRQPAPFAPGIGGARAPMALEDLQGPDGPFVNNARYPNLVTDPAFRPGGHAYDGILSEMHPYMAMDGGFGPVGMRNSRGRCYPGMHLRMHNPVQQHIMNMERMRLMDPYAVEDARYQTPRMLGQERMMTNEDVEEARERRKPTRKTLRPGEVPSRRPRQPGTPVGIYRHPVGYDSGLHGGGRANGARNASVDETAGDPRPPLTSADALEAAVARQRGRSSDGEGVRRRSRRSRSSLSADDERELNERIARRERSRPLDRAASMYSSGSEDEDDLSGPTSDYGGGGGATGGGMRGRRGEWRGEDQRRSRRDARDDRDREAGARGSWRRVQEDGNEASDAIRGRLRNLADRFLGPPPRTGRQANDPLVAI